ncbi:MAG: glycosyltransferase family 4 protein [Verrucomicrobiae bacterium]|nr:glycosyltransferase family 4 protein [Verrucomicrobiae bacterium]NNJ44247.1 glycosyltransferase [Akkermansiaceae bacterium]
MIEVLIHSPFARQSSQGNSVTADRLERMLMDGGLRVEMEEESYGGVDAECLIALNARRSAEAVADFDRACPGKKVIVLLTGTDINHEEMEDPKSPTRRTMDRADALVVLHDAEHQSVPDGLCEKCRVIFPSVTLPDSVQHQTQGDDFTIVMAGNMRVEKNPELAVAASLKLPENLTMHLYGNDFEAALGRIINHGMVSHQEMLAAMAQAHLLLNTSIQEGGANAICEAISMGLPVVASAIPGNIGMLGVGYAGLFPSNNLTELVTLLTGVASDPELYAELKKQVAARAPLFTYATEARAWVDLVRSQLPRPFPPSPCDG